MHVPAIWRVVIAGTCGALMHIAVWFHIATSDRSVTVALIGLVGSTLTALAVVFAAFIARDTSQRLTEAKDTLESVNKKVSAPRRIGATAGEEGAVVIQPPDVE